MYPVRTPFQCHMSRRSPASFVYLLPKGFPSPGWQADRHPLASKAGEEMFQITAILSS